MRTEELSDFLYKVHYEDLPVKAVDQAKLYIEDLLGVALAGSTRQQGEIWRSYFAGDAGRTGDGDIAMWQYSRRGKVSGIDGDAGLDLAFCGEAGTGGEAIGSTI